MQAAARAEETGRGPKVVAIGGGMGLSTLLRGLKTHTPHITAIVTVAEDGVPTVGAPLVPVSVTITVSPPVSTAPPTWRWSR